jgi:CheY-like chemotaxis protein
MIRKRSDKKILIVDDNKQMADCLGEMVDALGLDFHVAVDGLEAIERLEKENYSLVIADTRMPRVSGFELLKYVKKNHPSVAVAMISTHDSLNTHRMLVREQPDFYLPKPFTSEDVASLLAQI